ncbi:nicotinate-nucleotide adenylyltransferase [Alkalibacterium olivapovliticus]|uniref:Probable nicotinate-nucleotide adenylyltransferase n=1 Tax=Alkalibacterium olivapovliticus TaxID=99907 RepID=A0A2T0WB81_9LACT|nr:nicotinate-nucleotide adenylyltransferase [Alkalibacterium olivapovliticus]PRY83969.1 nicotinate-nucleotide adenylyltransferase [Alkalibacterium olivapovliticus]
MSNLVSKTIEPELLTEAEVLQANPSEKVGLLGGTFNPPHIGHLIIAEHVRDQLGLEKIVFLPSHTPPHKTKKNTLDSKHRVAMLKGTLDGNRHFEIDLREIERKGKSYTYDTIKQLKETDPDTEFYFIIGADMVEDLPNWYKIDELVKLVQFVAVNRPGYSNITHYPVIMIDVPDINISSSLIRQKVADGCSIRYLVTSETEKYIESEGLYKNEE